MINVDARKLFKVQQELQLLYCKSKSCAKADVSVENVVLLATKLVVYGLCQACLIILSFYLKGRSAPAAAAVGHPLSPKTRTHACFVLGKSCWWPLEEEA